MKAIKIILFIGIISILSSCSLLNAIKGKWTPTNAKGQITIEFTENSEMIVFTNVGVQGVLGFEEMEKNAIRVRETGDDEIYSDLEFKVENNVMEFTKVTLSKESILGFIKADGTKWEKMTE